jgi:C4-type Zn-finger protein
MPRCVACNRNLNNFETTRKIVHKDGSIYYPDLCNNCYRTTDIALHETVVERYDLAHEEFNEDLDIPEV